MIDTEMHAYSGKKRVDNDLLASLSKMRLNPDGEEGWHDSSHFFEYSKPSKVSQITSAETEIESIKKKKPKQMKLEMTS